MPTADAYLLQLQKYDLPPSSTTTATTTSSTTMTAPAAAAITAPSTPQAAPVTPVVTSTPVTPVAAVTQTRPQIQFSGQPGGIIRTPTTGECRIYTHQLVLHQIFFFMNVYLRIFHIYFHVFSSLSVTFLFCYLYVFIHFSGLLVALIGFSFLSSRFSLI